MARTLNPVTQLSQGGETGVNAPIGAESDNIYLYDKDHNYLGTLTELAENWEDFKENNAFMYVGTQEPNDKVQHWYDTTKTIVS